MLPKFSQWAYLGGVSSGGGGGGSGGFYTGGVLTEFYGIRIRDQLYGKNSPT